MPSRISKRKSRPEEELKKSLDYVKKSMNEMFDLSSRTQEKVKEYFKTINSIEDNYDELTMTKNERYKEVQDFKMSYEKVLAFENWNKNVFSPGITGLKSSLRSLKDKLGL